MNMVDTSSMINVGTPQSPKRSGSKVKKILIGIGVIAVIVLLAEVGYFIYSGYKDRYAKPGDEGLQNESVVPQEAVKANPTLALNQAPKEISLPKMQRYVKLMDELQGKSEFVDNAIVNLIVSGFVYEIADEVVSIDGIIYEHKIVLRSNLSNPQTFRFTNVEAENATVILLDTNGTSYVTYSDIQTGDKIVLDMSANLRDVSPNQLLIRILRQ